MTTHGRTLLVDIHREGGDGPERTTYELLSGEPFETSHDGEALRLEADSPVTLPVPDPPAVEPVTQPAGRAPQRRG
jgi:hypothetical protein